MYFITLTKLGGKIMGVIINGILGGVSGKVAGVVGAKWKDVKYLRAYAIPKNPDTPDQLVQRSRMQQSVFIARQLLGNLLQPYWNKFYSTMSGYNAWIKYNIMHLADTTYQLTTDNVMSRGNLLGVVNLAATYDSITGQFLFTWYDNSNGSTGLATDASIFVIANKDGNILSVSNPSDNRATAETGDMIATGLTPSNLIGFLFFIRGTGSALEVSDSSAVVPSAA